MTDGLIIKYQITEPVVCVCKKILKYIIFVKIDIQKVFVYNVLIN